MNYEQIARLPMATLLNYPPKLKGEESKPQTQKLVEALESFNVTGEVAHVMEGPVLSTYFFRLGKGIKYDSIAKLRNDLALTLKASEVRIYRVTGTDTVGIEIARNNRQIVTVREMLENPAYWGDFASSVGVSIALGVQANGEPTVINLDEMPHLLVAGSTGAGKSVALHSMLMSMLFKFMPWELQLGFVDLKRVELGRYEGLPHLKPYGISYTPEDGVRMLENILLDINNRYRVLKQAGVGSLGSYMTALKNGSLPFTYPLIPRVVIVIDEFGELILSGGKGVEDLVIRITQLGRAAGVHLVLATQRPVVKIVTGLIKANIPARLAFKCATRMDSMVILDRPGAENLLGKGDGLMQDPTSLQPTRIQTAFITEEEIDRVVSFIQAEHKGLAMT